jgi:hypothetical protein
MSAGSPALVDAVDAFDEVSSSGSSSSSYATVLTPSGGDDGAQIIAAVAAVNAAGGGEIIFVGNFTVFSAGTAYTALGQFVNCDGVTLRQVWGKLSVDPTHIYIAPFNDMFTFQGCNNVVVDGFDAVGTLTGTNVTNGNVYGPGFVRFLYGCTNVSMPSNRITGLVAGATFDNNNAGVYNGQPKTRGIRIGVMRVLNSIYGINSQFSGDDMKVGGLVTDTVHRDFFIYGCQDIEANIHSKDAKGDGVKLWSGGGQGLANIHINYSSDPTSTARTNSGSLVTLEFNSDGVNPVTHRNIWINFDIVLPGQAVNNTGYAVFLIKKILNGGNSDIVDRGHVLDGLTLTGSINGYTNGGNGIGTIDVDPSSKWGTVLDAWYNIRLENLRLFGSKYCRLSCAALKGALTIDQFSSIWTGTAAADLVLDQQSYTGALDNTYPKSGKIEIRNSIYDNQFTFNSLTGNQSSNVIELQSDATAGIGWTGHIIDNNGCGATATLTVPSAIVGRFFGPIVRVVSQTLRVAPHVADQITGASAANKYISLDVTGLAIKLVCYHAGIWAVEYYGETAGVSFQA